MRHSIVVFLFFLSINLTGQKIQSDVEFVGYMNQVLLAKKEALKAPGKLNSGEVVRVGCDKGTCYFEIVYKDRTLRQIIGDDITRLIIYEFDFGGDNDFEIVVVNDYKATASLSIFSYSRGIIQKLFEKEIKSNKVIIKKDYIEYYLTGGLESRWNYYMGKFWAMTPFKDE
jgi:hypothetical protein